MHRSLFFVFLAISCLTACTDAPVGPTYRYVHLAHTRAQTNPHMDSLVEATDWTRFDMLWLGGDLIPNTSREPAHLAYVDRVLHLGDSSTFLAPGNHDYDSLALLTATTGRPPYYFAARSGIGVLVLDTQDSLSHIRGPQLAFVRRTLAELPALSHLIVLHHKLIYLDDGGPLRQRVSELANGGYGGCKHCLNPNNFYTDIYPLLVDVERAGTEVLCIGGDFGFKARTFHYLTEEGIDLLGSGLDYRHPDKPVILFEHTPAEGRLQWRFVGIGEL